jgi:hypothetical protein
LEPAPTGTTAGNTLVPFRPQARDLHAKISSAISQNRSIEVQEGLARALSIASYFAEKNLDAYGDELMRAVEALTAKLPNTIFADRILTFLEQVMLEHRGGLLSRILKMSAGSAIAAVNLGAVASGVNLTLGAHV